ncbi:hypothetical protein IJG72_04605 [bacterium]|nr:hypothetical protein [bacterium]
MNNNVLNNFIAKVTCFPLSVKQVILLHLYKDLKKTLSDEFIMGSDSDPFVYLYEPKLSFVGKTELEERVKGFDANIYNFLECLDKQMSIIEIALNNFWTIKETCTYFMTALNADFIKTPVPTKIVAMAGFIADLFRTGEYFKRAGKINVDQLEMILIRQKELTAQGQKIKIAQVMVDLGYITEKDVNSLVFIREESNKRFIMDSSIVPNSVEQDDINTYKQTIQQLKEQNVKLKAQLTKLLAIFKKNASK